LKAILFYVLLSNMESKNEIPLSDLARSSLHGASHFILYVTDQEHSKSFYADVLAVQPRLHVPGMTEFNLPGGAVLGLMPIAGIRRLLGKALPDPMTAQGIPRAELYILVEDPQALHSRAITAGATELSPLLPRDWGHLAAYSLDTDGHVLAFASCLPSGKNAT
jgi:uncharacterized protein